MTHRPSIRVAFQGEHGAFSEDAIHQLFGDAAMPIPCPTFEELFTARARGKAECIVAPMENSLAGTVGTCYDLWLRSNLNMTREAVVAIHHCLIGCEASSLNSIRTVESHPVALSQCTRFFALHPQIRALAAADTAGSVRHVMESNDSMLAAIASEGAARLYRAKVLARNLEDHPQNFTRFAVLSAEKHFADDANKTSIALSIHAQAGSLGKALAVFAKHNVNLVKIEARPVVGKPWEYVFMLDLDAGALAPETQSSLNELKKSDVVTQVKILGSYKAAAMPADQAKEKGSDSQ